MTVPSLGLGDHAARGDIERGEERGRAMPDVVVCDAFDVAKPERQQRLRAIEGLDLALLIDAQNDRVVGWVEVEPDDVAHLLDEQGIRRDLEMLLAMGLETEGLPNTLDCGLRQLRLRSDGPTRPVGSALRLGSKRLADQGRDFLVPDRTGTAGARFVVQPREPLGEVPLAPDADGRVRQSKPLRNGGVAVAVGGQQNDPGTGGQSLRRRARPREGDEFLAFLRREHQRSQGSTQGHELPPSLEEQPRPVTSYIQYIPGTQH
jgi:hypothetical protein